MTPPPSLFFSSSTEVCHLKWYLYGLKQAPWAWFEKFRTTLLDFTFTQSQYDYSFFFTRLILGLFYFLCMLMLLWLQDPIPSWLSNFSNDLNLLFIWKILVCCSIFLVLRPNIVQLAYFCINISIPRINHQVFLDWLGVFIMLNSFLRYLAFKVG
jgi:hypothetical protein